MPSQTVIVGPAAAAVIPTCEGVARDCAPPFRHAADPHRRNALRAAVLLGLLAGALSGCRAPLVGEWRAIEVKPARSVFLIDRLQLGGDGAYTAQTVHGGIPANEAGTYEFDGFKMRFMPKAGGLHTYNANLKLDRLELWDKERRVILRKAKRNAEKKAENKAENKVASP